MPASLAAETRGAISLVSSPSSAVNGLLVPVPDHCFAATVSSPSGGATLSPKASVASCVAERVAASADMKPASDASDEADPGRTALDAMAIARGTTELVSLFFCRATVDKGRCDHRPLQ